MGLFRKLIDFEHRLSVLEGISDERRDRFARVETRVNEITQEGG